MATHLEQSRPMKRGKLIIVASLVLASGWLDTGAEAMRQGAIFRAGVNLVRVGAVVRDRKGRFIRNLTEQDFVVQDDGKTVKLTNFHQGVSDVTVALLLDVSGSMQDRLGFARDAASQVLAGLSVADDEAAIFTFDSRLDQVTPFTSGLMTLPNQMADIKPFGATSLYDAIAQTAERLTTRGRLRRGVVVFTDGVDTASTLTAPEVSGIASSIDVPVYIVGHRSGHRQSVRGHFPGEQRSLADFRDAGGSGDLDWRPHVPGQHADRPYRSRRKRFSMSFVSSI